MSIFDQIKQLQDKKSSLQTELGNLRTRRNLSQDKAIKEILSQQISSVIDEIDAIEIDQEVAELEKGEVEFNSCYSRVTQWQVVPWAAKVTLYASFGCMVTCCYMVQLFSNACFADYQLTYTIDEHLDGNWLNLVKPTGWYAILLFFVSGALLSGFVIWANVRYTRHIHVCFLPLTGHVS